MVVGRRLAGQAVVEFVEALSAAFPDGGVAGKLQLMKSLGMFSGPLSKAQVEWLLTRDEVDFIEQDSVVQAVK